MEYTFKFFYKDTFISNVTVIADDELDAKAEAMVAVRSIRKIDDYSLVRLERVK